jgi:hypothetical protein
MAISRNEHAEYSHWRPEEVKVIDGYAVRFRDVCVHEFTVGDVEDPDIMAGEPIWNWHQSEAGSWIMEHAADKPYWVRYMDTNAWGNKYRIMARLSEKNEIFWRLKWAGVKK